MAVYGIAMILTLVGGMAWALTEHKFGLPTMIAGLIVIMLKSTGAIAAELPVLPTIGASALPKNTPAQERREQALRRKCNDQNPPKNETDAQFLKRLSLPCPGRLE